MSVTKVTAAQIRQVTLQLQVIISQETTGKSQRLL